MYGSITRFPQYKKKMNKYTKYLLNTMEDYALKSIDEDITRINALIDSRIEKGRDYKNLAKKHKALLILRRQVMMGV